MNTCITQSVEKQKPTLLIEFKDSTWYSFSFVGGWREEHQEVQDYFYNHWDVQTMLDNIAGERPTSHRVMILNGAEINNETLIYDKTTLVDATPDRGLMQIKEELESSLV